MGDAPPDPQADPSRWTREVSRFRDLCRTLFGVESDRPPGAARLGYHNALLQEGWDDLVTVTLDSEDAAITPPTPVYALAVWFPTRTQPPS